MIDNICTAHLLSSILTTVGADVDGNTLTTIDIHMVFF